MHVVVKDNRDERYAAQGKEDERNPEQDIDIQNVQSNHGEEDE
jgi:hypothetical protein